jgi:lipid-binding SYLF domain-containing protein
MTSEIRRTMAVVVALILVGGVLDTVEAQDRRRDADVERINDAITVLGELATMPAKGIPRAVLEKAEGIVVFPRPLDLPRRRGQGPNTLRTARMLDVRNRGIFSVRNEKGMWSPPAFLAIAGGTAPEDADLVLVVVNRSGLDNLTKYEFHLGEEPIVAPGPIGNDAKSWTAAQRNADILIYARARGALTGISLSGSVVRGDTIAHQRFYGKPLTTSAAIAQTDAREPVPQWRDALAKHTSR